MSMPPGSPPPDHPTVPGPYPPPPPPAPYQGSPPPGPYPPQPAGTNWWAIVSLVFGILGGVLISVVCGIIALNRAKRGQGGRGMAIAGLVLSALWVLLLLAGVGLYFLMGKGPVGANDVKIGDCLAELPDDFGYISAVDTAPCDQPHKGEVFAVMTMPDGAFPGQQAIEVYQDKCGPELATYSAEAAQDPDIGLFVLYPTASSWGDGDRLVTCIATSDTARTGSLKD